MKLKLGNFKALFGKRSKKSVRRKVAHNKEKEQIEKNIKKSISTCVIDPYSAISLFLKEFTSENPEVILFEDVKITKDWLMQLIHKQYESKILKIPQIKNIRGLPWEKIVKKLANASVDKLLDTASSSFKKGDVLVLQNPQLTKTKIQLLEKLARNATLVIVAKDSHIVEKLPSLFQVIQISQPSTHDTRAFIWQQISKNAVEDPEFLENRLLFISGGDPEKILNLIGGLSHKEHISIEDIRNIQPLPGTIPKLNLTYLIAIIAAIFVALRGIALGKNDQDLYIVGAIGAAIFFTCFHLFNRGSID